MSDITVTDEMVELAAKAIERLKCLTEQEFEESLCRPAIMDIRRKEARAVLSAVVPIVVKGEKELLLNRFKYPSDAMVEAVAAAVDRDEPDHISATLRAIAAAIRSDTGGET